MLPVSCLPRACSNTSSPRPTLASSATVHTFNTQRMLERLGPDHWDHVIIDECHHVPADSYRAVVESIRPALLVGLTATPERTDGQSLLSDFDGSVAAELRLWHALERQLLVPFEYYGISDNTDLRGVRWSRGTYATDELEHLYTGNDARAALVLEQTARRVGNLRSMRALGFCVSVPHAEFMAQRFTDAGIPSLAVHGGSDRDTRDQAPGKLRARDVNVLFTCDLYNEGVDLPFVDTLLLLRPTSSATLFLQQLGRGLRIAHGKESCLVLDFIGQHREDFRFDKPLSALTGISRGALQSAVDQGFPTLPSGCHLSLDRVARDQILQSLKRTLRGGMSRLVEELRTVASRLGSDVSLRDYLDDTGRDPGEVFTKELSWSRLRRAAGLPVPAEGSREDDFRGRLRHLLHVDDPERLRLFRTLDRVPNDRLTQRRVLMLAYLLFDHADEKLTADAFLEMLREHPAIASDLRALSEVLQGRIALAGAPPPPDAEWPLSLHRRYHRREILTAIGRWTEVAKPASREGVVRIESEKVELLFVTLDKSEKRFSPTTSYEDYAISAELFHWQSQSGVSPESPTGRRYVEQERNGWRFLLFVRSTVHDLAYTYLGPVHYVSHVGSRPMSITWRMQSPIPGRWLTRFERLAG